MKRTSQIVSIFFNVGLPKEDIFFGHLLSPIFQSTLHITITSLCLCVFFKRVSKRFQAGFHPPNAESVTSTEYELAPLHSKPPRLDAKL